jgi:hypothetical protein
MFAGEFVNHEIGTIYKKSTAQRKWPNTIYRRPLATRLYGLAGQVIRLPYSTFDFCQTSLDIAVTKI